MFLRSFALLALAFTLSSAARAADLQALSIDPAHSRIDVAVRATVDSFVGNLTAYKASLEIDPSSGQIRQAGLKFAFADLKTGKTDRDAKMLSWEDSAKFPDAAFVLTGLKAASDGSYDATGTFTMHGVTRRISFPVSVTTDRKTYAVDGSVKLDTRDYGLPVIRVMMFLKVDPAVVVRFHLQAVAN